MPRRKTSLKRTRQDRKRHDRNVAVKQQLKKTIKKFVALLSAKDVKEAKALLGKVFSHLDRAAKKNIIHPATENRRKSRLLKRLTRAT